MPTDLPPDFKGTKPENITPHRLAANANDGREPNTGLDRFARFALVMFLVLLMAMIVTLAGAATLWLVAKLTLSA